MWAVVGSTAGWCTGEAGSCRGKAAEVVSGCRRRAVAAAAYEGTVQVLQSDLLINS